MKKEKFKDGHTILVNKLLLVLILTGIVCLSISTIYFRPPTDCSSHESYVLLPSSPPKEDKLPSIKMPTNRPLLAKTSSQTVIEGDTIGSLSIPSLNRVLRIVEGTGDEALKKGVGHFSESVLPGEKNNCVLSGHRDTVFTKLDSLKIGDLLIAETSNGKFNYEIKNIRIVDKDDKSVIVNTESAVLTLTTCYPFHFFGDAQQRYIITADLLI